MSALFKPLQAGALTLPNRILMAPLTRCRAEDGHVPGELIATHYAQRASAGLIIAEATMAMAGNSAFWHEPGIYSDAQVAGWKKTTDAVHQAGGRIVLQIWHGGRACHPLLNDGAQPVAPSAIAITGDEVHTPEGKKPYVMPRPLRDDELPGIVDEFLRDGSNTRSGPYGGPIENRARLLLEVLDACCEVWSSDRVGLRLSPLNSYNSMRDSDPVGLSTWLAQRLNAYRLAYLHVMRGDFFGQQKGDVLSPAREHYEGVLIGNMGYSAQEAATAIETGLLDAVAFGVPFLANPDLPARFKVGAGLNAPNPATFYSPGAEGYTDYPFMQ